MTSWNASPEPEIALPGLVGWVRVALRGSALVLLVFGGFAVLLLLRLLERPIHGMHRPWTPAITQFVCRNAFRILGMGWSIRGTPMRTHGAIVANHGAWLDIFSLNAARRLYFVSKAEVSRWPGIGWLARATGTVFIERDPKRARAQTTLFQERLLAGHTLLFFPEGTSTDGLRVLPFKTTLFEAFFRRELKDKLWVQPVSVFYNAPDGTPDHFYGWWGDMGFGAHLISALATRRQGGVELLYHPPVRVADFADRKALAHHCEQQIRKGHAELAHNAGVALPEHSE